MRTNCLNLIVFCILCFSYAQEAKHRPLLKTTNWGSEFFDFPIKFAPTIPYKGYEEAVFPKGWSNKESIEFWSYAFAWKIEKTIDLSPQDLELQLEAYFDGLMNIKNIKNGVSILPTKVSFKSPINNLNNEFLGAVYLYEGRYNKQMMLLYTKVSLLYCENKTRLILLFKFSPLDFNSLIWEVLDDITVLNDHCE